MTCSPVVVFQPLLVRLLPRLLLHREPNLVEPGRNASVERLGVLFEERQSLASH